MYLDVLAFELAHIAHVAEVVAKYDNSERTGFLVLAEVKGEVSVRQWSYGQDLSGYAGFRTNFLGCRRDRNTFCGTE